MKQLVLQKLRSIIQNPAFYEPPANALAAMLHNSRRAEGKNGLEVELYGSAVNGFETKDSDIDCTIILPSPGAVPKEFSHLDPASYALQHFNVREKCARLRQELPKYGFQSVQVIEARIPLVKFKAPAGNFLDLKDPSDPTGTTLQKGIAIDVTVSNILGFENSKLLKAYSSCRPCRELGLFVKLWAKSRGIIDAQNGILCAICYLIFFSEPITLRFKIISSCENKFGVIIIIQTSFPEHHDYHVKFQVSFLPTSTC